MGLDFLTNLPPQGGFFFAILLTQNTMPATAKYKEGDSVNKRRTTAGMFLEIGPAVGQVISMREKSNKKGTPCIYCTVKWKDGRTSEHAHHMLIPAP